jgi:hypothetical protein
MPSGRSTQVELDGFGVAVYENAEISETPGRAAELTKVALTLFASAKYHETGQP